MTEKKAVNPSDEDTDNVPSGSQQIALDSEQAAALAAQLRLLSLQGAPTRDISAAKQHQFNFWNTQPVPKLDEKVEENTFIEPNLPLDQLRHEPYSLPDSFEWSDVVLTDAAQLKELYTLLTENYVEDDDNMFRFDYSPEFLQWALMVPGYLPVWHCGVRAKSSKKLVAFIAGIPQRMRVYDKSIPMVEINFLCVHKKLRSKRVAPVLIKEITRRVNLTGIFQAAFTAGVIIPKPLAVCRYYHRSLNPKKLIECRFSYLSPKMTIARTMKLYKLPSEPKTTGLRPMEPKDVSSAFKLLNSYLVHFKLTPIFEEAEFAHMFLPRPNVIYSFVVESGGNVTDLISFYSLPSSVMQHPTHKTINAAYSYYNVATSVPLKQLLNDALIMAHLNGFDVFNALDVMENKEAFDDLKFAIGDGNLQYYLYNWKCPDLEPKEIGLVLQ